MTAYSNERERLEKLLYHLKTSALADVPADLLLEPLARTRPNVRIVAYCGNVRQVLVTRLFRTREIFKVAPVVAVYFLIRELVDVLTGRLVSGITDPRIEGVTQMFLGLAFMGVVGGLLVLVAQFVLGRITMDRDPLFLDLNELIHYTPTRSDQHTPWRDVYTAEDFRSNWIGVKFEHGGYLACRLLDGNRDVLVQIIRELVRHHHPDLYGQMEWNCQPVN